MPGIHPTHKTRFSDASTFDTICVNCGATDVAPGGFGQLAFPCPKKDKKNPAEVYPLQGFRS